MPALGLRPMRSICMCIVSLVGSNFEDSSGHTYVSCELWFGHKFQSSNCERDNPNKHG